MKTRILSIGFITVMTLAVCQPTHAQLAQFCESNHVYDAMINDLTRNSFWIASMERYTKNYKEFDGASRSSSYPAYRRYPAVQFKSTGTRVTIQEILKAANVSPQDEAAVKKLALGILKKYEAEPSARRYPNDWALAFVSFIGLNSHVYNGKTDRLNVRFEQDLGLRNLVAVNATYHGIFKNVSDRQKQEMYEIMVIGGGLTYYFYQKALRENNAEDLKDIKLVAAIHLKIVGIKP